MLIFLWAGWQSGYAAACKAVDAGSIPAPASKYPSKAVSERLFYFYFQWIICFIVYGRPVYSIDYLIS